MCRALIKMNCENELHNERSVNQLQVLMLFPLSFSFHEY